MAEPLDIKSLLDRPKQAFQSKLFHSVDSDSLQFYLEDVEFYAERIDCWLTIYKQFGTHRLIGFKIKNIRILLSKFDALGLAYSVSRTGEHWVIMAQPMLAYIPVVMQSHPDETTQYHDVLTSFGDRLKTPVEVAYA